MPTDDDISRGRGQFGRDVRPYTRAELARHDGSDPTRPILIGHAGKVYDVTASLAWSGGSHWGDHGAGQDLTGALDPNYHGPELLRLVPCVGTLVDGET